MTEQAHLVPSMAQTVEVVRPRLDDRLDAAVERFPLTVITGPAGSGKTVLLRALARRRSCAFLVVRREHADGPALMRDLIAAIARANELTPPPLPTAEIEHVVERVVASGATLPVLIVEDLEQGGPPAAAVLADVLDRCRGLLHVVIAARSVPHLGVPRRRLSGTVAEFRGADLAFTPQEGAELFARAGLELSADQSSSLVRRTEGWAAGLRLAATALQRGDDIDRLTAEFGGEDWAVSDYLVTELLDTVDGETRRFLVETSVTDRICGDLAMRITGSPNAPDILRQLANSGCLIVPLDDQGHWYRYHRMLRDLLRSHLRLLGDDTVRDLEIRAGEWLVQNGHGRAALRHLIAARAPEKVTDLLRAHWAELLLDPPPPAAVLVNGIAADQTLALAAAATALAEGRPDQAVAALDQVDTSDPPVSVVVELLRARALGDLDGVRAAATELEEGGPASEPWQADETLRLLGRLHLGLAEFAAGNDAAAEHALEVTTVLARDHHWNRALVAALSRLAALAVMSGRLRSAEEQARAAVALSTPATRAQDGVAWAYAALAAVGMLRAQQANVDGFVDLAMATGHAARDPDAASAARVVRAQTLIAAGDAAGGAQLYRCVDVAGSPRVASWCRALGPRGHASELDDPTPVEDAIERLAAGDALAALRRLQPALEETTDEGLTRRVHAFVIAAVARDAAGQLRQAETALDRALELAAREQLWGPFQSGGPTVRRLLARHVESPRGQAPTAGEVLQAFGGSAGFGSEYEPLSERELRVLRLLPTLMSSAEIGAELLVSVNTVKTHTRSIYRKLEVSSRRAAVARAQQIGLL